MVAIGSRQGVGRKDVIVSRMARIAVSGCCAGGLLLAGCSGAAPSAHSLSSSSGSPSASSTASPLPSPSPSPTPSPTPSPSPSPTPTPTPTPTPAPAGPAPNPLTGALSAPSGVVTAVKIDNSPSARPLQKGIAQASLVYQELIEGGATRFMAIFVGGGSFEVGPARSARPTDLAILAPFGHVVFAFSGANAAVMTMVRKADVVDAAEEVHGEAYTTAGRRPQAYNFYTTLDRLDRIGGSAAAGVTDVGLRFGDLPSAGTPVTSATVHFNGTEHAGLSWDAAAAGWRLDQDGRAMNLADGGAVVPANVVVQFVSVTRGAFVDVDGNNSPDSHVVGTGAAWVFRDGQLFKGSWSRAATAEPTHYLGADGQDLLLAPGQTWIMLVPTAAKVSLS